MKNIIVQMIMNFLLLCFSTMVFSEESQNDCGLSSVKQQFSDLTFVGPLTIDETQSMYSADISENETEQMAFDWNILIKRASESAAGCVYFFSTDEESWNLLRGIKGFTLIENGKALDMIITSKS
ncbi:hypothetical protein [Marinomonas posidonica]|uniref:hypothetical protein n=1 Tax=Marinomonas posidonica TaxID=936476 RepID=UPI00373528D5